MHTLAIIILSLKALLWELQATPVDRVRTWAYNNSATVWEAPTGLWEKLSVEDIRGLEEDTDE